MGLGFGRRITTCAVERIAAPMQDHGRGLEPWARGVDRGLITCWGARAVGSIESAGGCKSHVAKVCPLPRRSNVVALF